MRIKISHNTSTPSSPDTDHAMTDYIRVDVDSIPNYVREDLAKATYEAVKEFYSHPENEVKYQKWLADRKAKGISK